MNFWIYLCGIFLIFGPDSIYNVGIDGSGGLSTGFIGPRAAIIGLQLTVQASLGVCALYFSNAYATALYGAFAIFNTLCLIGSNFLFNYNEPIWELSEAECSYYFRNGDIQRCHDNGYLEFLRVIGTLAIITEGFLIVISIVNYATAIPHTYAPGVGVPGAVGGPIGAPGTTTLVAGGVPAAGYGAERYPAGVTTTGYATGVPAATTTTYTTQPTGAYTTQQTTTTAVP